MGDTRMADNYFLQVFQKLRSQIPEELFEAGESRETSILKDRCEIAYMVCAISDSC